MLATTASCVEVPGIPTRMAAHTCGLPTEAAISRITGVTPTVSGVWLSLNCGLDECLPLTPITFKHGEENEHTLRRFQSC